MTSIILIYRVVIKSSHPRLEERGGRGTARTREGKSLYLRAGGSLYPRMLAPARRVILSRMRIFFMLIYVYRDVTAPPAASRANVGSSSTAFIILDIMETRGLHRWISLNWIFQFSSVRVINLPDVGEVID